MVPAATTRGGERPRIVVTATLAQIREAFALAHAGARPDARSGVSGSAECEQLGPIRPWLLGRLACDAVLERVLLAENGAVLSVGRAVRTTTAAQRRALAARDGGCAGPGCLVPAKWCDVHHVTPWAQVGLTDIDQLVLPYASPSTHHPEIAQLIHPTSHLILSHLILRGLRTETHPRLPPSDPSDLLVVLTGLVGSAGLSSCWTPLRPGCAPRHRLRSDRAHPVLLLAPQAFSAMLHGVPTRRSAARAARQAARRASKMSTPAPG